MFFFDSFEYFLTIHFSFVTAINVIFHNSVYAFCTSYRFLCDEQKGTEINWECRPLYEDGWNSVQV